MGYLLGIVIASVALMFICIIFFPKIKIGKVSLSTFYFPPLVGAIILISTGLINYQTLWTSMTASNTINPIFILVLFFSMTLISIVLDEAGFFRYLAEKTAQSTSMNQKTLFLDFYILISVLTIFTSNDIIILTFTPFLMSFCKKAKIDPLPYIVSEFVAANTWSILLIIGNPTNIYLASSFNATFFSYLKVMYLPAIFAGLTSFLVMRVIFNKKLQAPLQTEETNQVEKPDLHLMLPSLIFLVVCVILLAVSSFIGFSMWLIALCSAVFLILYYLIYGFINLQSLDILVRALKRLPYELIPFVLSMFVLSYGLQAYGVAQSFASLFGSQDPVFRYGLTSFLACNVINNIPMSVFYTSVIQVADSSIQTQAMYASVIGSNIGAFLSPIGALAGIMWMSIIKDYNYDYSFGKFTLYGTIVSVPTIFASLSGLLITLL